MKTLFFILILLLILVSLLFARTAAESTLPPLPVAQFPTYLTSHYVFKGEVEPMEEKEEFVLMDPEILKLKREAINDCFKSGFCKGK